MKNTLNILFNVLYDKLFDIFKCNIEDPCTFEQSF